MILFHQNFKAHKISGSTTEHRKYKIPGKTGTLALDSDMNDNILLTMIERPIITKPVFGESYEGTIEYSPYINNPLYTGSKTHTRIQVATDINFTDIIIDKKVEDDDIEKVITTLPIDKSQTIVYIRLKYYSGLYSSPWSETVDTAVKKVVITTPTILIPANNATGLARNLVIGGDVFTCSDPREVHESTTYQVSSNSIFNNLLLNITTDSVNQLTSYIFNGESNRTYYIRIRYNGRKYGNSDWSATVKAST